MFHFIEALIRKANCCNLNRNGDEYISNAENRFHVYIKREPLPIDLDPLRLLTPLLVAYIWNLKHIIFSEQITVYLILSEGPNLVFVGSDCFRVMELISGLLICQ